jgi:hypothetical protein
MSLVPQHSGVLFMSTQQVQPASSMQHRQSQQAWIISQHWASPLVQVIITPESVHSQRHMPMVRLQVQVTMPLQMVQQLHRPPASMVHRFWTMLVAILSSHEQMILQPPVHFSILMVQRGTIIMLAVAANPAGAAWPALNPGMPRPAIPEAVRSNIIVLDIPNSFPRPAVNAGSLM